MATSAGDTRIVLTGARGSAGIRAEVSVGARFARQSVLAGMRMSFAAMAVATGRALTPVAGALVQEASNLGVILNALRALRG